MRVLIDSHIFIWLLYEPEKISGATRQCLEEAETVELSTASLWELTLKYTKNKLPYRPDELTKGITALGVTELIIKPSHLHHLPAIDLPHSDPFDRLLIAQCLAEGLVLLTADRLLVESSYRTADAR